MANEIYVDVVSTCERIFKDQDKFKDMTCGQIMEEIIDGLMVNDGATEWAQELFLDDDEKMAAIKTFLLGMLSFTMGAIEDLQEKYGFNLEEEYRKVGSLKE